MNKVVMIAVSLAAFARCSTDARFKGHGNNQRDSPESGSENATPADSACPDCRDSHGSTDETPGAPGPDDPESSAGEREQVESFDFQLNQPAEHVDYLFVMDNSVSMAKVRDRVVRGIASLSESDVFPKGGRMAVISTIPASLDNLAKLHPAVSPGAAADALLDPGFLRLVSRPTIEAFLAKTGSAYEAQYPLKGCETGWFTVTDRDADGAPCIEGALQIPLYGIGAEAGLTAFKQLLQKNKGQATFRKGAVANVIFLSDTHDPGIANAALVSARPTYEDLKSLVAQDNVLAGFYLHAIAPETDCTDEDLHGKSYFAAVASAKGQKLDICTATDYGDFIKTMAKEGAKQADPLFVLKTSGSDIDSVTVDGQPVSDWSVADGNTIKIPPKHFEKSPNRKLKVEVKYHKGP